MALISLFPPTVSEDTRRDSACSVPGCSGPAYYPTVAEGRVRFATCEHCTSAFKCERTVVRSRDTWHIEQSLYVLVILDGVDDLLTQIFGFGLAEVLADNALNVSREGEGWLVIVAHWCPVVPTD